MQFGKGLNTSLITVWTLLICHLHIVFSPLTSAEACEKSSRWLWKDKLCWKHICITDHHDMTLAGKVALNPNTTNHHLHILFNMGSLNCCCPRKRGMTGLSFSPFIMQSGVSTILSHKAFKTLWVNEKMLVTSIFFFSHSVF